MAQGRRWNQQQTGAGQLTLVEHALCPLDGRASLSANLTHETSFDFTDKSRKRRTGRVLVHCPHGLSSHDELFLWGLLGLTLADRDSDGELCATRHYILRTLGMIDTGSRRGGKQYDRLSAALRRLAAVQYENDSFYDPIRAEHRRVSFGLLSYSLPVDPNSSRAWRIVWDPLFFELAYATGGKLRFDWQHYRQLDSASRRLYLFLAKLFARCEHTHPLNLNHLAVNVLGFSATLIARDQKTKVARCLRQLSELGIIRDEPNRIRRVSIGEFRIVVTKGPAFSRRDRLAFRAESPLVEPLADIGFDTPAINRILKQFPQRMVREWVDITLAARERFGRPFFKRSPMAYMMDNLKHADAGTRTPPDWWHDVRRAEERSRAERAREGRRSTQSSDRLPQQAINSLTDVHETIFEQFQAAGQSEAVARRNAQRYAKTHRGRRPSDHKTR
ncbi:MAG: hypothetical protein DWQ34_24580 [Planctomycetota bacterium]|nr:MAG: hypothetical protein DWQ34_24580 [Planctomycetota bacterium]